MCPSRGHRAEIDLGNIAPFVNPSLIPQINIGSMFPSPWLWRALLRVGANLAMTGGAELGPLAPPGVPDAGENIGVRLGARLALAGSSQRDSRTDQFSRAFRETMFRGGKGELFGRIAGLNSRDRTWVRRTRSR